MHVFGTASGLAIGLLIRARMRWQAALALFAVLACGGYQHDRLTTTNRLSVSKSRSTSLTADVEKYKNARADLQAQIKWLEGLVVEASPREARRLYTEITKRKELQGSPKDCRDAI